MSDDIVGDFTGGTDITSEDVQYFLNAMKTEMFLNPDSSEFKKSNITHKEIFKGPGFYEVLKLTLMSGPETPTPTSDKEFTNNNTITWTWNKIDGAVKYLIKINEESKDPITTEEYTISNLTEGVYKISVASENNAGNTSNYGTHTVVIDTTAPDVPQPTTATPTKNKTPTWTWNAVSGDPASYDVQLGSGGVTNQAGRTYTPSSDLSDGSYTIQVRAKDALGNTSTWGSHTVVIDTTAPSKVNITNNDPITGTAPNITWQDSTDETDLYYTIDLTQNDDSLDGYPKNEGGTQYQVPTNLPDGTYTIKVTATDTSGNTSTESSYTFTIDTTAPDVPQPTTATPTKNKTPTWTWNAVSGDPASYDVQLGSGSITNQAGRTYTPSSNLSDGSHTIKVRAKDALGNTSAWGTHTVVIDTTAPDVPNPRTTSPTDTLTPTFTWSDYVGSTGETYKFGVRFGKAVTNFEDLTETVTTEKSFTPSANIEVGITYKIYVCSIDNAGNKSEYGQFDVIKNVDDPIINTEYEIANASADIEVSSNFNEIITHGYGFNGDYYTWNSATSSFEYKQEVPLDTSTTEQNVYITNNYGKVRRSILSARYFPMFIKDTLIYVEQSSNSSIGPSYYCTVGRYPGLGLYGTGTRCSSSKTLRYSQNGKTVEYSLYDLYYFQANVNYSGYRILKSNGDTLSKDDNWKTSFPTTTWNESSTFSPEHNVLICTEFVNTYDQRYNASASGSGMKVYPYIPSSLTNEYKKTDVHYNASNFYWRECNGNYTSAGGNPGSVRIRNHSSSFTQNPFNNAYGLCFYHLEDGKWVKKKNVTYNPEAASQNAFPKFLQKYSSFTKDNTIHINAISSDKTSLISAKYIPTTQTYLVVGKTTIDTDLYGKYDSDHVFALSESIILVVVQDKEYKSKIMKIYQVDGSTDSHTELWSFTYTDKNIEDINISEDRTNVCILSKDAEDKYEIGIFTTSGDKQKLNYLENANLQETTRIRINSLHISNNFNSTNDGKSYTNVKRVIYSQSGIKFIDFHNENEIDTSPPSIDINDADTPTNDKEISWSFAVEGHSGDVTGKIKSKPSSSSVSVVTISGNTAIITADVEGEYSIELIALNEAGNAVTKTSNSVTYDKTPTNEPNPSTTTPTNNLKPTWSWSGVADAEKYKVTLSSDSDTTHEITNTEFTPSSNLTEGGHTISVIAVDEAGNESEAGTHTVVIDATAPSVPNPVSDTEFTNNNTITWTWNKIDGAVKYLIKINEESKDPITTEEYTISELEEGIYKISVASEDNAGNTTNYGTHTVKFDLCGEFYYDIKMNWESLHEKRSLYSPSRNSVDFKEEEPPNDYFGTPSWIKLQSSPDPQDNTEYNHWVTALIPRKYKLTTDVEELTLQYSSIYTVSPARETTPFLVVKQNDTLFFQSTSSSVGETIKITKDNFLGTFFGDQPNLNFTQDSQFEFGFGFVQGFGYNLNTHVNISKFEMCWSDGGKLIDVTDVPSPTTVTSE